MTAVVAFVIGFAGGARASPQGLIRDIRVMYRGPAINLRVDGRPVQTDVEPFILMEGNRVMVPVRHVAEALVARVLWDYWNSRVEILSRDFRGPEPDPRGAPRLGELAVVRRDSVRVAVQRVAMGANESFDEFVQRLVRAQTSAGWTEIRRERVEGMFAEVEVQFERRTAPDRASLRWVRFGNTYARGFFTIIEGPGDDVRAAAEVLRGIARSLWFIRGL